MMVKRHPTQGRVPTAHSEASPTPAVESATPIDASATEAPEVVTAPASDPAAVDRAALALIVRRLRKLAAVIDGTNPNFAPIQFLTKQDWQREIEWAAAAIEGVLVDEDEDEAIRKAG